MNAGTQATRVARIGTADRSVSAAVRVNTSWTSPGTAQPENEGLTLQCESMLRALGMAVNADRAALILCSARRPGPSQRFEIRITNERRSRVRMAPMEEHADLSVADASGWIERQASGLEQQSHLRAALWQDAGTTVLVDLVRGPGNRPFEASDVLRLRQIAPGLTLAMRAVMACPPCSLATDLFRRLPFGVALLTRERRILFQNAAMLRVVGRRDNLVIDGGVLRSRQEPDQRTLERAVRQIINGTVSRSELIVLARDSGRPAYLATLERFDRFFTSSVQSEPVARLTLVDPDHCDDGGIARVAEHFGLTASEIDVVQAMVLGLDVAECAARLRLAINTVRWHQKRIFAKTGTSGRPALILLFIRGSQLQGA